MGKFRSLLRELWKHKVALGISLVLTATWFYIYRQAFTGESLLPTYEFFRRAELITLDTRFQIRYALDGAVPPDPRIAIVDIDQASQETLGRWPFPRSHFATMLEVLREDGAQVVVFDVTFSKPDEATAPIIELRERLRKQGAAVNPRLQAELDRLEKEFDHDHRFAAAIERFGKVVLGNFFLYTDADLVGVEREALERYANEISYFPISQLRVEETPRGRAELSDLVAQFEALLLAPRGAQANIETLGEALSGPFASTGFFNVSPDPDGVVRRANLTLPFGLAEDRNLWAMYPSIDLQGVRLMLGLTSDQPIVNFNDQGVTSMEFGDKLTLPPSVLDGAGRMMINYRGPVRTYPYVSIGRVVNRDFPPGTFKDKLVLVGASATGIGDLRSTPFGGLDYPGVEIHANIIDNILNRTFLERGAIQDRWDRWTILLFGIPVGLFLVLVPPRWMALPLLLLIPFALWVQNAFEQGWWLNFSIPAFMLVSNASLVPLWRVLFEEKEKRKVRGAFQQYLSPEVIRRLLVNPESVQPRKTQITTMFSDIRGFTSISEKLDAQELALLLNEYLTDMTRIVFRHRGTLDKYIGDAVMAFWGAPFEDVQHARGACDAALEMMVRVGELQRKWTAEGKPEIDIGLGINTGVASVGNMGSSLRYGYTAMGDSVNLASRLEGLNKEYKTHILVSEFTHRAITDGRDSLLFRELDLIQVKGKLEPVTIYELMAGPEATNGQRELAREFDATRALYQQRQWKAAQEHFETILERWPDDGPSRTYWKRCQDYLFEEPPPAWDGVYVMTHK